MIFLNKSVSFIIGMVVFKSINKVDSYLEVVIVLSRAPKLKWSMLFEKTLQKEFD